MFVAVKIKDKIADAVIIKENKFDNLKTDVMSFYDLIVDVENGKICKNKYGECNE